MKVKIIGCGSIGNHYANVYVNRGHRVYVTDKDPKAIERMVNIIYPNRYGKWDNRIKIIDSDDRRENYDLTFIGTPPASHLTEAIKILKNNNSKIIHIEKPVSLINDKNLNKFNKLRKKSKILILNGYNLNFSKPVYKVLELIRKNHLGKFLYLNTNVREHWEGIFKAHPWIKKKNDTYLTNIKYGGGALLEHSHALSYWMFFSYILKKGKVKKVKSDISIIKSKNIKYDNISNLLLETDNGLKGKVSQDVITKPEKKNVELIYEKGKIELINNYSKDLDLVSFYDYSNDNLKIIRFKKTRADDFIGMVKQHENIFKNGTINYLSSIDFGLDVIKVIEKAFNQLNYNR